jgi:putative cardiolipin synthase
MHNKSLTADGLATIVGGRNIGDPYFDSDPTVAFVDLDVLAVGKAAAQVDRQFDLYWNSEHARSAPSILGPAARGDVGRLAQELGQAAHTPAAKRYLRAVDGSEVITALVAGTLGFEWVPVTLVNDLPSKTAGKARDSELLLTRLTASFGKPSRQLEIISPYFVPGDEGVASLCAIARRGVKLRIVTNSLAANDVVAVHAGYARSRKELLACGVRLFELKPLESAAGSPVPAKQSSWRRPGSSHSSLHGKIFSMDRERAFVGSFNLDPRSMRVNTEMGFVIDSPTMAGAISDELDHRLAGGAYELRLDRDGELQWLEQRDGRQLVYHEDPGASTGRRAAVWLLSLLPIEDLL